MSQKNVKTKAKKKKVAKKARKKKIVVKSFWQQKELLIPLGAVLLITFIAFIPSLSNAFVNWDDDANFISNPNLQNFNWESIKGIFTSTVMGGYNPLSIFTLAIEKAIFGLNPAVFHINNLILHLVCVYFVYRIMLMLNISKTGAIIAALLFGIHPMRVESVAWVTERKDVLFGAFYLAAIFNYIKYLNSNNTKQKYYTIAIVLFIFSLFSKIQAVSLPLSLLAIDYYFKRPLKFKLIIEKAPFFILSLLVGGIGVYLLAAEKTIGDQHLFTFVERLFVGAYSFCVYLVKFIFPYPLSPVYPYPKALTTLMYAAPLGILAIFYLMYRLYKKDDRAIIFGFVFFLFNVMFVLQIVGAGQGFIADRFTYIPYLGLFFIIAILYDRISTKNLQTKNYLHYGLGIMGLFFAGMTWVQCGVWKNGETLWSHMIKHHPVSLPYINRAHHFRDEGKLPQAIVDYKKAIQINPNKSTVYNSLGKVLFDSGKTQEAISNYNKAIQLDPNGEAEFYINRGVAYGKAQNYDLALKSFNKSVEIDPNNKNIYFNRSLLFSINQQFDLAIKDHDAYLNIDPNNADVYYERGIAKRILGRPQEGLADQNKAIQINPSTGLFYMERSQCYRALGNNAQALQEARLAQSKGVNVPNDYLQELQ